MLRKCPEGQPRPFERTALEMPPARTAPEMASRGPTGPERCDHANCYFTDSTTSVGQAWRRSVPWETRGGEATIEDGGEIYSLKLRPLKNSDISLTFRYTGVMLT